MISKEEIYRRCWNNYGMTQDEIDTLVLKGTDYSGTDEEKLNAFYSHLLTTNKLTVEDSFGVKVKSDDRKLDDSDNRRLDEIRRKNKKRKKVQTSMDQAAFDAAGEHLAPKEKMSYSELMEQLKNLDLDSEDDEE